LPIHSSEGTLSNFLPQTCGSSQAPTLLRPAFAGGQRVAVDPATGQIYPAVDIGGYLAGSGNDLNGIKVLGSSYITNNPGIMPAPRIGIAYDLGGRRDVILHVGGGGVDSDQVHTLLAMSMYALHRYQPASRHFEVLFERQPTNTTLQYLLSESYMRSHQTEQLPGFLQQLQAVAPDSPVIHMLAGEQYDRLGQTEKAIPEFLQVEAAAPDMPLVHFVLGYFYWEHNLLDKAAEQFEGEVKLKNGEAAQAKGFLGDIALRGGRQTEAEHLLRESLQIDPKVRIAHYDLGVICAEKKDTSEAVQHFRTAIALDTQRADAYYRLATLYRQLGELDRQRAMLAKVEQLHAAEHTTVADMVSAHETQ
jgi:tetratricopeptide (TPR) repeat protein